ncbi:TniB family NTP-binding protein [Nocardia farcinica]|uniref:TniB family NTP-binding protein n=1 Tax=Nocardia farcinica TaxID=37329 RepID=UPI0024565EAE|nr:TniB family NTP-binding protein [Nocardia farcinica]
MEDLDSTSTDARRRPATTLEGWRLFVDEEPAHFELLSEDAWKTLGEADRTLYDEARMSYHSEMIVVATSTVRDVAKQGRLLTVINRRETGARRGLILSGPQTTGKTTALKQLGRTHELRLRAQRPGASRIPVVYVTTPPKGSPRKLAAEFARFLGLGPIKPRHNVTDIADAVCQILITEGCELVLIDEIHNLNNGTSAGEDLSDHIKYFTEHLPATFVYAGIDVENCGLFTGVRGKQIAGRCVLINTTSFPFNDEWRALVASLEDALRLHRHEPGSLVKHARYLHTRTGGMIGSLSHLVRAAATTAILDGTETLDLKLLKSVRIDYQAESGTSQSGGDGPQ